MKTAILLIFFLATVEDSKVEASFSLNFKSLEYCNEYLATLTEEAVRKKVSNEITKIFAVCKEDQTYRLI